MEFDALRTGNVDKLEKDLAISKHQKKSALKDAINGVENGTGMNLPKAAAKEAPGKKPATKEDVKAFHKAIDAAAAKKDKNAKMNDYKKVLRYVKLDKKCLAGAPSLEHADIQLAEIRSYMSGKGGVSMCQLTFVQLVSAFEKLGQAWDILPMLGLRPGFAPVLMEALAKDPTLYDPELQEMLIELGGFESAWWMRLGAKTLQHWRQYSFGALEDVKQQ